MNQEATNLQQRWDSFLTKIDDRFQELLTQSATILPQLLDYQDFDTLPFNNAWTGIESQAKDLISKIDQTWADKVSKDWETIQETEEALLVKAEVSLEDFHQHFYALYYSERDKGYLLMRKLEKDLRNYEISTFAAAGRKLQAKAQEILSGNFSCSQCMAQLPVQQSFYRSYYQVCLYCQTTNTFEPGTIARNIEHFALHPLAEEKALPAYWQYWELLHQYKLQREDGPGTIAEEQVINAFTTYVDVYLHARIAIIPDYKNRYEEDRAGKIAHLRRNTLCS